MDKDAALMTEIILLGGRNAGFNTNPDAKNQPCFIEENGEKIVCLAQGGECRYNHNYYSPGMGDAKSWRTPVIEESCPDACCYKVLVCDKHDAMCEGSIEYYPEYNKFRGQFKKYFRNFDKYLKPTPTKKKNRAGAGGQK